MKKVRRIHSIRPIKLPKINYKPALFFFFLFTGLLIGVICIRYGAQSLTELAAGIFEQSRTDKSQQSIFALFFSDWLASLCFLFAAFTIGLCAVGLPFLPLIPLIKGIYLGALGGYMYTQYGLTGIGYCALVLYPGAALMLTALIYACTESMMMSADICSMLVNKTKQQNNSNTLKLYCVRYGVLTMILFGASIIDTTFLKLFGGYFSFG